MVGGAVLLIPALVVLLTASVAALIDAGFEAHWAALIVGGAAFIVGAALLFAGTRFIRADNLAPNRTIEHLQRDLRVAKHQLRHET